MCIYMHVLYLFPMTDIQITYAISKIDKYPSGTHHPPTPPHAGPPHRAGGGMESLTVIIPYWI